MPKKKKPGHQRGSYRSYSEENMKEALSLIKKGVTMYKAHKMTGVPRQTLCDKVHGRSPEEKHTSGPDRLFTVEEEEQLVEHVKKTARYGYGYTRLGMRRAGQDMAIFLGKKKADDELMSDKWLTRFLGRHPDLKMKKPKSLSMHERPKWNYRYLSQGTGEQPRLLVSEENGVRHITLADPKTRNSLSLQMLEELQAAVTQNDPSLQCIVLGAQGKVFSAGHNLKELTLKEGRNHHEKVFDACTNLMLTLQNIPVPVVAKVNGVAAAAGCQLVASCDIVIATQSSSFSTPGGNVGIFCSTPGIPLVRCVPRKVSAHMLLTGLPITAEEALRAGLVSKVVSENELEAEAQKTVDAITQKSRPVIALGKKFMYKQMEIGIEEAYREGGCVMVNNINMKDGQEGISSFIEKRKPNWSHADD